MLPLATFAQDQTLPTRRILPKDVVQDSIQLHRISTNSFMVRFTYTEAGASRMLAFDEAHQGQAVATLVGEFKTPPVEIMFRGIPPHAATYAQWKEGWLKYRTSKFFGVSEGDANKILAGLKSK